jgi:hypothetical protein
MTGLEVFMAAIVRRLAVRVGAARAGTAACGALALGLLAGASMFAQQGGRQGAPPPPTLGLDLGVVEFDTPAFTLKLVKASQTIAALEPKGVPTYTPTPTPARGRGRGAEAPPQPAGPLRFDFTPADRLSQRAADGFHHLGDITLRLRSSATGAWVDYDTASARKPIAPLQASGTTLAAADLSPTLPADIPVRVTRSWRLVNGRVVLSFEVANRTQSPVEIGALGLPVVFNNIITGRNLEQAHEICSFFDPYIGLDAGYVQVTRLSGKGPALVVVPHGRTPFEGWNPMRDGTRRTQTSEGIFEWLAHTRAYAENEWKDVQPWNAPSSATLQPGESRTYGLELLVSPSIREIEATLARAGRPVAVGLPGYVAPMDEDLKLFLDYDRGVKAIDVEPRGALAVSAGSRTRGGWQQYTVRGRQWGRARLTATYDDGTRQSVSYYVIKPAAETVADLGRFLFTKQWYENPDDPFGRSPSVMSYNRALDRIVEQDARVWIAGLGDEGGSGSWLAAAMKLFGQPAPGEVAKYERFVHETLWGGIQYSDGPRKFGVRKSLLYYDPKDQPGFPYDPKLNWTTWTSWNKEASEQVNRAYNYPHVVAAYLSMYRIARNTTGLVTRAPADWYLNQAYETMMFLTDPANKVGYVNMGLMGADVFVVALEQMKREGWTEKVASLEARMKARTDRWAGQRYPFGSEMAWDSTGQEEVYAWTQYFGHEPQSLIALDSIVGYMPTVPHWGYNGAARRYWDFIYAGAPGSSYERQLHHYGSGLNAIPALARYREAPDDFHLLRIGYAGTMGALTNIDRDGFAAVAFHSFPHELRWDAYSGDYGPNFLGHALNTGTYVVNHPEFGWQALGGNVSITGTVVGVEVTDSFRQRVYIAPRGLFLTLDAGRFERVEIDSRSGAVRVTLAPATAHEPVARLRVEQPAAVAGVGEYRPAARQKPLAMERGAYVVPLSSTRVVVELTAR